MSNKGSLFTITVVLSILVAVVTPISLFSRETTTSSALGKDSIYGISKTQDKVLSDQPQSVRQTTSQNPASSVFSRKYLGKWKDPDWNAYVVLYLEGEKKLSMTYSFDDGSKVIDRYYIQKISNWKAVLKPIEDDFGEYYILDLKTSDLKLYDDYGYASSLRAIEKVSLAFLND